MNKLANIDKEKKLTNKQLQVIEQMVYTNKTQREIAKDCNVAEYTISKWKKNPLFMQALKDLVTNRMQASAAKALNTMVNLLSAKSEMVRFQAAKDILDRTGFKAIEEAKVQQIIQQSTNLDLSTLTDEQIKRLLENEE